MSWGSLAFLAMLYLVGRLCSFLCYLWLWCDAVSFTLYCNDVASFIMLWVVLECHVLMFASVLLVFLPFIYFLCRALLCPSMRCCGVLWRSLPWFVGFSVPYPGLLALVSLYCAWLPCYGVAYIWNVMPWPMVLCDAMQSLPIPLSLQSPSLTLDYGVLSSPCTDLLSAVMLFAALFLLYCNAWRCDPFEIPCYGLAWLGF